MSKPALKRLVDCCEGGAELGQDLGCASVRVVDESREDMFGADVAVATAPGLLGGRE